MALSPADSGAEAAPGNPSIQSGGQTGDRIHEPAAPDRPSAPSQPHSADAGLTGAGQAQGGLIGWVVGRKPGPLLICVGGLHGNEPAGVRALTALIGEIRARRDRMAGDFVAVVGNVAALAAGRRFMTHDLNRIWTPERVLKAQQWLEDGVVEGNGAQPSLEEVEMIRLLRIFAAISRRRRGPVHVLDLHTTSGAGGTFTTTSDLPRNRDFALAIPVPLVLGLDEHLSGTLLDYLDGLGYTTTVCECGQHSEPRSVMRAEAAIWLAIRATGLLDARHAPEAARGEHRLRAGSAHLPQIFRTVHRHAVTPRDRYQTLPGFTNFQSIQRGDLIGIDRRGEIASPADGRLLMPLYQELGEDGFFVVRDRGASASHSPH